MDELQQAIAIAEAGNSKEAQMRLARYLKRQPDSVEGWMALSRVINDRKKKKVFLNKVLTLDPLHVLARSQLAALEHSTVTPDMPTVIESNRPAIPAGFSDLDQPPVEPSAAAAPVAVTAATPVDELADGVGADDGEQWTAGDKASVADAKETPPRAVSPGEAGQPLPNIVTLDPAAEDSGSTDWLLVGLGGLAIFVGLVLIFLLLQFF